MRIRLERFLTPNHLALIVARDCGLAAARGLALVLEEPWEHDDGFANLEHGRCDLILTGPLHLLEPVARAGEPLGCLFETDGGVLVREDRLGKLRAGETIRVASSVAAPLTDSLCRRIPQDWPGNQGFAVAETQIAVEPAGFHHVDNLHAGSMPHGPPSPIWRRLRLGCAASPCVWSRRKRPGFRASRHWNSSPGSIGGRTRSAGTRR